jgi:hypothetical protein
MEQVVAAAPFPVYEPARLPAGFVRVHQDYVNRPLFRVERRPNGVQVDASPVQMVILRYSDGLARIDLYIAPPEDMRRFEEALRSGRKVDIGACPTSIANAPDELIPGDDDLVVRRNSDRCRTVLKIDDLGGVTVALVGRNEIPPDAYVEVVKSLARVAGSKPSLPGRRSIEDWQRVPIQSVADEKKARDGAGGKDD